MEAKRLSKQLIYGGIYLVIFGLIIYGGYRIYLKPAPSCFDNIQNQGEAGVDCGGPCASCELRTLKPVSVVSQTVFFLNGPAALLELDNPNPRYGADKVPYKLEVLDKNGISLGLFDRETFIYPGERKFLIIPIGTGGDVATVSITPAGKPNWIEASQYPKPNMVFQGIGYPSDSKKILISGTLKNEETLAFPKITIGAIFYDKSGSIVSVSQTEIRDVLAFEGRYFQIEHPASSLIDVQKTRLFFDAKRP